ncbi:hypothetical protein BDR07DRAFT_1414011 [Suillus spraguei]|nr:hypothetical protein BDR07DRAFT_1445587 [Suillus spraguei]KAG2354733.1 hypothetical protein BDR07DRAFT_1428536 [Suillus spraguei]KAG2359899.1 hypothetical protein BDR07DRAFT_1414011 [Suillus spraguei]
MILYVQHNEETSCLKIVHFHHKDIPSKMEANAKIPDEAFPEITVDLMFIEGQCDPKNLTALAHHLKIPRFLMFMNSPGSNFRYPVAEFGTRIIWI